MPINTEGVVPRIWLRVPNLLDCHRSERVLLLLVSPAGALLAAITRDKATTAGTTTGTVGRIRCLVGVVT